MTNLTQYPYLLLKLLIIPLLMSGNGLFAQFAPSTPQVNAPIEAVIWYVYNGHKGAIETDDVTFFIEPVKKELTMRVQGNTLRADHQEVQELLDKWKLTEFKIVIEWEDPYPIADVNKTFQPELNYRGSIEYEGKKRTWVGQLRTKDLGRNGAEFRYRQYHTVMETDKLENINLPPAFLPLLEIEWFQLVLIEK